MSRTPKKLLKILSAITAEETPKLRSSKATHHAHIARVYGTLKDPNIVGVGISRKHCEGKDTGELCICFYVAKKKLPSKISQRYMVPPVLASADGEAAFTDVKEVGNFAPTALVTATPIESGYSVSHISGSTGTVGAIVQRDGGRFILSNSHVLARSGLAIAGDQILYPGVVDGGTTPSNWIANLTEYVPFMVGEAFVNDMDVALAQVIDSSLPDVACGILGATSPPTTADLTSNVTVTLQGRTSGQVTGQVQDANFHFKLSYSGVGQVCFRNQVLCDHFTQEGDSGSLVLDATTDNIVGLHFAEAVGGGSVFSPIGPIIEKLNFTFISN